MTNGEKIQTILDVDRDCTEVHGDNGTMTFTVTSDFWNAEYKESDSSIEEKCPCYHCEHFEIKGWSHCKIHEGAYGDSRCNDYHKVNQEPNKSEIPTGSTTKDNLALIHTWGLDEEIRCIMCTDHMKSNRGCDGSCVVNKDMYNAVMDAIEKRIQPTNKNGLVLDCVSRQVVFETIDDCNSDGLKGIFCSYDDGERFKEYIKKLPSVTPQEPRIITCKDCKYYRNKGNKRSYCTKRLNVDSVTDRYREPNFYCADAVLREVEE